MKLFLLPISSRRTLIYCQRLNVVTAEQTGWIDKGTAKAANLWASWEKKESGWQRKIVDYGNTALKRIPYEEWGLKSIPPLSARRKSEELVGKERTEVHFPSTLIPKHTVEEVLKKLGTERAEMHRKRMIYCFIGMPISAPFALVPVIPNLPFFYLVFRAWSHWRAWAGSKHIQFLLERKLIMPKPSAILDQIYASGKQPFSSSSSLSSEKSIPRSGETEEMLLLDKASAKKISEALKLPELDIELDRAIWQVENALKAKQELKEEKSDLDKANTKPNEK